MQDLARRGWDRVVGKAVVFRKGEGLPWELPRSRDGIFTSSSDSARFRVGLRNAWGIRAKPRESREFTGS